MTSPLRFLVVESKTQQARRERRNRVGQSSGEAYIDTLLELAPGARCDQVKPADPGAQGDSVLRVGIGVSAIHALGDGRWRPGMSGSDGARGADLWEVFSVVPDHRRAEGKRYPLAGLVMIALAAMLAGRSDQLGIVRWGRKLSREALAELGILRGRVPAPSVWSELFRALDVGALERLLGAWV